MNRCQRVLLLPWDSGGMAVPQASPGQSYQCPVGSRAHALPLSEHGVWCLVGAHIHHCHPGGCAFHLHPCGDCGVHSQHLAGPGSAGPHSPPWPHWERENVVSLSLAPSCAQTPGSPEPQPRAEVPGVPGVPMGGAGAAPCPPRTVRPPWPGQTGVRESSRWEAGVGLRSFRSESPFLLQLGT